MPDLPGPSAGTAVSDDFVLPFQIDRPQLRGRLVHLGAAVDTVLTRHDYPEPVAQLLGEVIALAAALAGALKYEGVFTLQIKGDGAIRMVVADVTSAGDIRGYAAFDEDRLKKALAGPVEAPALRLLGAGHLAFTVDQGQDTERYQGIVELRGATLAECVHHYFRQSEQLQAGIRVTCGRLTTPGGHSQWRAGALMLQRLPREGGTIEVPPEMAADLADADDDWQRSLLLMGSGSPAELIDPSVPAETLLFRMFHEDGVRVFPIHHLQPGCRCSRERVVNVLGSLPRSEVTELKVDGVVVVTCEFCNSRYAFSDAELADIYEAAATAQAGDDDGES